ncbi:MAG TPA: SLC13 family permease, partial [Nitrospiria bacterium]|nr:SLC13 family permease [Nitrospiria bacterium]
MTLVGIPVEFSLFGFTLLGVAIFHHRNFEVAIVGLSVILAYKIFVDHIDLATHFGREWHLLFNLGGLLLGFAILARQFEDSRVPDWLPQWLPDSWVGGFVLLVFIAAISTFLDNIAAAMIGGVIAKRLYRQHVSVGYLAAIVAASNAGGAGSVIGDTTTTMMWIAGVPILCVAKGFIASVTALIVTGVVAGRAQQRVQPIHTAPTAGLKVDAGRLVIVLLIIGGAVAANVLFDFPAVGVWAAIILGTTFRSTPWEELGRAWKGSLFLLALVTSAS